MKSRPTSLKFRIPISALTRYSNIITKPSPTDDADNKNADEKPPLPSDENPNSTVLPENVDVVEKKETEKPSSSDNNEYNLTLSIALKREEIEADIIAMNGGKRIKRMKRKKGEEKDLGRLMRDKGIMEDLFPGLMLCNKTTDWFKQRYGLEK